MSELSPHILLGREIAYLALCLVWGIGCFAYGFKSACQALEGGRVWAYSAYVLLGGCGALLATGGLAVMLVGPR